MDILLSRFLDFIQKHQMPVSNGRLLLAVSGGLDSVVMAHLFHKAGILCDIAHCNFQLREAASDEDEQFVLDLAAEKDFGFYTTRFATGEYASTHALSVQMAARQLRYQWFEALLATHSLNAVATAHHADDIAETMLLNLVKRTGISGMHGIRAVHGNVIRPLLFATRMELENYAQENGIKWREDASNKDDYYQRNKIRNKVIPLLREINPQVTDAMIHYAGLMEGYESLVTHYLAGLMKEMVQTSHGGTVKHISLAHLAATPAPAIVLYHILKPYGGNETLCEEILSSRQTGAEFFLNGYKIVHDRECLTIFTPEFQNPEIFLVKENDKQCSLIYGTLELEYLHWNSESKLESLPGLSDNLNAYFDRDTIKFPLEIRKWQKGDYFHPMGMKGKKLVSDFFTDEKFTSVAKETTYLMLSDGKLVWIIGHRIDEAFKIKQQTQNIIHFRFSAKQM